MPEIATHPPRTDHDVDLYPLVSVIMPVRNEADFIEESLGAVLAQDYPKHRMEILVADGMSTDSTVDIVLHDDLRTILWPMPPDNDPATWALRRDVWEDSRAMLGGSDSLHRRPESLPSSARTSSMTLSQSPNFGCRNSLALGYQGLSWR